MSSFAFCFRKIDMEEYIKECDTKDRGKVLGKDWQKSSNCSERPEVVVIPVTGTDAQLHAHCLTHYTIGFAAATNCTQLDT